MRLAVRIHDQEVIEHLKMLDAEHGRGAKSRFVNEAILAYLGRRVATVEEKENLKTMVRQLVGVATNVHQLSKNANMQKDRFAPAITELENVASELNAVEKKLRRLIRKGTI